MIPICHSGQRKDQLPFPFSELQALQLEDETFPNRLVATVCKFFHVNRIPPIHAAALLSRIQKVKGAMVVSDAPPELIHSSRERTKLITDDLETLLESDRVTEATVWTSSSLSSLAIGRDDPYPAKQQDLLHLLLKERDLLLSLARKGCTVKCIISPANKYYLRYAGLDYAIRRTKQLLEFLRSDDAALNHIDWAISELGTKNLYVIGNISCFEGYKKGIQQGYGLTLRQTSHDVINSNIRVYQGFFKDLAARSLAKWASEGDEVAGERELLRSAAERCLKESSKFLTGLARSMDTSRKGFGQKARKSSRTKRGVHDKTEHRSVQTRQK